MQIKSTTLLILIDFVLIKHHQHNTAYAPALYVANYDCVKMLLCEYYLKFRNKYTRKLS